MKTFAAAVVGCLVLSAPARAADPVCQDTNAIKWHLPGQFEQARKAAESQNRMLMIKGIAFGIDEAGAKCATKGCW